MTIETDLSYLREIKIKAGSEIILLPVEKIGCIEAQDNYVLLHTERGRFMERGKLSALAASLPPQQFCQVSRSAVVNLSHVRELRSRVNGAHSVILKNGSLIAITRNLDKLESAIRSSR